jgi:nucleoid DNA-binding protein
MAERFPQLMFKDAENACNLIIDELIVALATGDKVSFQRFGSFNTREVPERTRTNPRNGAPVEVPAKRIVKFNAGNELRERCGLSEYLREREISWGNRENVGVDVLEKYSNHPDRQVVGAILENEKCTPELVAKLAGRLASSPDPADRLTVASSGESCPPELIRQFCSDKDESVRAKAAEHCSADMFEVLALDKSIKVRNVLVRRRDLTGAAAELLSRDKSDEVRTELAKRSALTEAAASILAHDTSSDVRSWLAKCTRMPPILSILARDAEINVRMLVLKPFKYRNEDCPAEILGVMADDESKRIRIAVAKHHNCPESLLFRLATDPDKEVREGVASRYDSLSTKLMEDLARDAEPEVRRTIVRREDCPVELLRVLAIDSNSDVRCSVAANEVCPTDLLRSFAIEPDPWIRVSVGRNTVCPSDLLAMLATDESDDVREAVANNKNCPDALLERLRHDKAPSVFGAALRTIHSR